MDEEYHQQIDNSNSNVGGIPIDGEWHEAELELAFNCFWTALNNVHYEMSENNFRCQEFCNYFITLFGCLKNSIQIAQNSLTEWKERQRILSIGPFFMQNQHYQKLATLRAKFANIQFKLKTLMDALMPYRQQNNELLPNNFDYFEPICIQQHEHCSNLFNGIPLFCPHQHEHCLSHQTFHIVAFKLYLALQQMATNFLQQSIIFSQQPPVILQSNRADVNAPRASRSRFDLSIEIFGASSWFPVNQMHQFDPKNGEIHCFLRRFEMGNTEENAIQELESTFIGMQPNNEDFVPSQCEEQPSFSIISVDDQQLAVVAKFSRLGVNPSPQAERKNTRRPVQEIRYRFCFQICLKFSMDVCLNCWKVTLPFPITHCKNVQIKSEGLLERAFPNFPINRDSEIANGENVAEILDMAFQEEVHPIDANSGIGLSIASKRHLLNNLDCASDGFVLLANFFKTSVPNRQIGHNLRFNEWFFRLTDIIRDSPSLRQLWENGLVYGFCGKHEAEQILRENYQSRMMLIRFADTALQGDLKVTFGKQNYVQHACFDAAFMAKNNLVIELLENDKFNQIECIYNWHGQPVDLRASLNQLLRQNEGNEEKGDMELCQQQPQFSAAFEYSMNQVPANANIANYCSSSKNIFFNGGAKKFSESNSNPNSPTVGGRKNRVGEQSKNGNGSMKRGGK